MAVRAIAGAYNLKDELNRLRSMPRVRKGTKIRFNDGPQAFSRHYVEPKDGIIQTFHLHLEEYGPGGKSQKHGHVNEAAFYILDGTGYEIHDGIRYDWSAGDIASVHNNCVHQHFNANPDQPVRLISAINRICEKFGLNDLEQLEDAPQYQPGVVLTAKMVAHFISQKAK